MGKPVAKCLRLSRPLTCPAAPATPSSPRKEEVQRPRWGQLSARTQHQQPACMMSLRPAFPRARFFHVWTSSKSGRRGTCGEPGEGEG